MFFNAVGDLDYDGTSYRADWPTSVRPNRYPSTFLQQAPTSGGGGYTDVQFVTDTSTTESGCDIVSGSGCVLPPPGPGHFFPYWTLVLFGHVDRRAVVLVGPDRLVLGAVIAGDPRPP